MYKWIVSTPYKKSDDEIGAIIVLASSKKIAQHTGARLIRELYSDGRFNKYCFKPTLLRVSLCTDDVFEEFAAVGWVGKETEYDKNRASYKENSLVYVLCILSLELIISIICYPITRIFYEIGRLKYRKEKTNDIKRS